MFLTILIFSFVILFCKNPSYRTSETQPPPLEYSGTAYFERSPNPFDSSKLPKDIAILGGASFLTNSCNGWMTIDWCENAIGFTPDGTYFKGKPSLYTIKKGYFKDGRMFAYPDGREELIETHLKERINKTGGLFNE